MLVCVALVSLGVGALTAAVVPAPAVLTSPADPAGPAQPGAPSPGTTAVGPVTLVLPAGLEPWDAVPEERMAEFRAGADAGLDGAWGVTGRGGVLLTVMTAPEGAHGGAAPLATPAGATAEELRWPGREPHVVAGWLAEDVREGVLVVELPDGHLLLLSLSGPADVLPADVVQEVLRTVTVASAG